MSGEGVPRGKPERPAELTAWIECRRCGKLPQNSAEFMAPIPIESSDEFHVAWQCPECGAWAHMHIHRTLKPLN